MRFFLLSAFVLACNGPAAEPGTSAAGTPALDSEPGTPNGQTDSPPVLGNAPASASTTQREALYWLNTFRAEAGAPLVAETEALNRSAQGHARFVAENGPLFAQGLGAHDQVPAGNSFTGATFWDRILAAGYLGDPFREVIAYEAHAAGAVAHWLETPYHRLPLLDASVSDVGYGAVQRLGDHINVLDLGRDGAADAPSLGIAWPPNGAVDVPLS